MDGFEAWAFYVDLSFFILDMWVIPFLPEWRVVREDADDLSMCDVGLYIVCRAA